MKNFFRLLSYLKRHWTLFTLGMGMMIATTLFGGATITMLYPIFDKLFKRPGVQATHFDQRPLGEQISLEFKRSVPDSGISFKTSGEFVGNLGRNFQALLERNHPVKILGYLCVTFLLIILIKSITYYIYTYIFGVLEERFVKDLRDDLFSKLTSMSLIFYDRYRAGDLISRMISDVDVLKQMVVANFGKFIYDVAQIIIYLTIAMVINLRLTLFTLLVTPAMMLILGFIAKRLKKYSFRSQVKAAGMANVLQETITSIKVVLAFVRSKFHNSKFAEETRRYYRARKKMVKYNMMNRPVSEFLSTALGVALLWYGGNMILDPGAGLNLPAFAVFIGALYSTFQPLRDTARIYNEWQKGLGVAVRYFEIQNLQPDITSPPDAVRFTGLEREIAFENVSFSYDGKKKVLQDIDLRIAKGEAAALVGPSGGGKTTLANLIPRFYDPYSGRVTIDGVDVRKLDLNSLRRRIGIVTQETVLFHDSAFNNIAYGYEAIDPEKVYSAAQTANAHDFITGLSEGYDTIIGERGSRLSGGQKQRIAIARAILLDPEILIFDEATSALDSEAEQLIQEALANVIRGRTVIIIAHRLSTIRHADRILVMEGGRIVEEGAHDDLMSLNGCYRRLHDIQYSMNDR